MTAALSLLTPIAARVHFGALIALRVLEGFFEVRCKALRQCFLHNLGCNVSSNACNVGQMGSSC